MSQIYRSTALRRSFRTPAKTAAPKVELPPLKVVHRGEIMTREVPDGRGGVSAYFFTITLDDRSKRYLSGYVNGTPADALKAAVARFEKIGEHGYHEGA